MAGNPQVTPTPVVTPPKTTKFDLNLQTVGSSTGTGATNVFQYQPKNHRCNPTYTVLTTRYNFHDKCCDAATYWTLRHIRGNTKVRQ